MDLYVKSPNAAVWNGKTLRCAVGREGFISFAEKREGDGATPIGHWPMREVFYRPDRLTKPQTALPVRALQQGDGWCDSYEDPNYNRLVLLPYKASAENLWRGDDLYDIIVVLGYNDDPPVPGKGSAIFLHIGHPDYSPSAGCVHLSREDLLMVLREADRSSLVIIDPSSETTENR